MGSSSSLKPPEPFQGNAYQAAGVQRLPVTLGAAAELFEKSTVAADAFGGDVVAHYLNNARVELAAFNAAVTDWERTWIRAALGPVIGLTTYLEQVRTGIWDVPAAYLPSDYFEGVIMAGGTAVLLPPARPRQRAGVLDGLDAL